MKTSRNDPLSPAWPSPPAAAFAAGAHREGESRRPRMMKKET